jgi:acetyl esterase/lipase
MSDRYTAVVDADALSRAFSRTLVCAIVICAAAFDVRAASVGSSPKVEPDGAIHVPAFLFPESSLLSGATRASLKNMRTLEDEALSDLATQCPSVEGASREHLPAIRRCQSDLFYRFSFYKHYVERYPTTLTPQAIGGIYTEVFTPKDGISLKNKDRVLINVHGGGFKDGSRTFGHLESMPIAATGKIKVISVDYRQSPEYAFPAASEDVAAVYRELLNTYQPKNIGIYGCSAGSLLTAESIAWFQKEGLPLPGAVGMFGGGAGYYQDGDSGQLSAVMSGFALEPPSRHPYFKGTDPKDPLAFPIYSAQVMEKFPPSLLIATTRDIGESAVVYTHSQLVKLGVDAELHMWEGVGHCFEFGWDFPESADAHDVIVRFFDQHLGSSNRSTSKITR